MPIAFLRFYNELSMSKIYKSFNDVHRDVMSGVFSNEPELKHAFFEAFKNELGNSPCHKYIVEHWLKPALDERIRSGRPDIWVSNVVIEVERPRGGLEVGRRQLEQYMRELYERTGGRLEKVYGLVTDGEIAELLEYDGREYRRVQSGDMPTVSRTLIHVFCSQGKIPVTAADDLVKLFGV